MTIRVRLSQEERPRSCHRQRSNDDILAFFPHPNKVSQKSNNAKMKPHTEILLTVSFHSEEKYTTPPIPETGAVTTPQFCT